MDDHADDVTLNEACKKLKLTKRMMFYRIRTKDIQAHKHGWQWFIFKQELAAARDLEWYRNSRLTSG